jgi:hypothetical protein
MTKPKRIHKGDEAFIQVVSARTGAPVNNGTGPSIRTRQDQSVHARSAPITLPKISILEKPSA